MTKDDMTQDEMTQDDVTQDDIESLTLERFRTHLNSHFTLPFENSEPIRLQLVEASALESTPRLQRQPFSLLFKGPQEPCLSQASYHLLHEDLGQLLLFLVPIQSDDQGTDYEAVFT